MTSLLYPAIQSALPIIVSGKSATLVDEDGNEYIDGSSGVMIANIGHGNSQIAEIAFKQMQEIAFCYRSQFRNAPSEQLAKNLTALSETKSYVFFLNSGSEANDAAIRVALQYFQEIGRGTKREVIGRHVSNHGNTVASLSVSQNKRRDEIDDITLTMANNKIPACYCYRCPMGKQPESCQIECAHALEEKIQELGEDNVAAFIAEPVTAAAGGVLVPHAEYFEVIRAICDRYDVLLITDEVVTGLGRTGKWFGMHHWNAHSDITVVGKGVNAGYATLSAVMLTQKIVQAIDFGTHNLSIGHTHSANPLASAVANGVVKYLKSEHILDRVNVQSTKIADELAALKSRYQIIGDVRSIGMLAAIEFVKDRSTKEPFASSLQVSKQVTQVAMDFGLVVYPCRDLMPAGLGDAVLIAPPLNCRDDELIALFSRLDQAIAKVSSDLSGVAE